jgi:DNA-binding beta-propeller fold protein YncE
MAADNGGECRAVERLQAMPGFSEALLGELSRPDMQDRLRHLHEGMPKQMMGRTLRRIAWAAVLAACAVGLAAPTVGAEGPSLKLEVKIPLGNVAGRIDHMAIDLASNRLFVAELGNNSVGVVDLGAGKVVHRIAGLKEPQGVAYFAETDTLYVANRGDGSVRIFRGSDYALVKRIELNSDADNIRVDRTAKHVIVGFGAGGLALIDISSNEKLAEIPLKSHPESFQLDPATSDIFVNTPDDRAIVVLDRLTGQVRNQWQMPRGGNFAMALDNDAGRVLTVFRDPATLTAFAKDTGKVVAEASTCNDVDDLFFDAKRKRVYVSCGEGFIDVRNADDAAYARVDRIATVRGARTSLFVPELDLLLLAVRAQAAQPAAIWVFRPSASGGG